MDNEHEQLEALQKWWNENGRSAVVGLVLGLGAVFGWTSWKSYQTSQAETASVRYENLVNRMAAGDADAAIAEANSLMEEFPESGYATLAALAAAHSAAGAERLDEAAAHLRFVIDNAGFPEIAAIARVRLARVLLAKLDYDEALAEVRRVEESALGGVARELEGDVLVARGESDGARSAYARALEAEPLSETTRARVRMKLDDLGQLTHAPNG